ncbi:MAG: YdeI/OmpD-associated family protein [Vicingaceae bacterium]
MKKVDEFIEKKSKWKTELESLRTILNKTVLEEDLKWGAPVYTLDGKNVVGLGAFKSYVGLWFFQGVFLKDKHGLLVNAQEGKTKALRQIRFSSLEEIDTKMVKQYVEEAIQNQKEGKELKPKKKALVIPNELQAAFDKDKSLASSFDQLSPGKQKDFANHISDAKQEKTKLKRLEKIIPMIKDGVGLHDKYKNC